MITQEKDWSGVGKIVHAFSNPPAKEAIAVEFEPGGRFEGTRRVALQKKEKSVLDLGVSTR